MKKWLNNPGLKITALVVAILIWLIIVNVNDPIMTRTISNVPVHILNGAYVESMGDAYKIRDGFDTISVRVRGNRSVVEPLTADDITAVADLTEIVSLDSDPITVPVRVSATGLSGNNITPIPTAIEIDLEELVSSDFVITGTAIGTPAEGYEVGRLIPNVEKVTITGPTSIISIIDRVEAPVDVSSLAVDTTRSTALIIYDKNGSELTDSQLSYLKFNTDQARVAVDIRLYRVVEGIELEAEGWIGSPKSGYQVLSTTVTPATVSVVAPEDLLKDLEDNGNKITISKEEIDISGLDKTTDIRIENFNEKLPIGMTLAGGQGDSVIVTVEIMPYNSKTVHFPVSLVERANLGSNLACGIAGTTLNIGVKGSDSLLKEIDAEDISVSIDLKDLKEGTYAVDADIVLPDGLELVEPVVTEVTISSTESVKNPD